MSIERTDNIGMLARKLAGTGGEVPDFTAGPLLVDALLEAGDQQIAMKLQYHIGMLMGYLVSDNLDEIDPRQKVRVLADLSSAVREVCLPLILDFNSVCNDLAGFVAKLSENTKVEANDIKLQVVKIKVGSRVRLGNHVTIDETRQGVVVSNPDENGFANVMPLEDETSVVGYPTDGMPVGMIPMTRTSRW